MNWITAEKFFSILKNKYKNVQKILNFEIQPAVGDGENLLATLLLINIKFENENKQTHDCSFMLKIPMANSDNEYHDLFIAEIDMYEKVIPKLEKMYANVKRTVKFKPENFKFSYDIPCDYLLMEDLVSQGFQNLNRFVGMNVVETKAVLGKLAQWHAASAKCAENEHFSETYSISYFGELEIIEEMNNAFSDIFAECIELYQLNEEQKKFIMQYTKSLSKLYLDFGKVDENSFNVMNHGDFWINNIMFQKSMTEVVFIDFQLPKYGNPAMDLFSFLITSPNMQIKLSKFDEFINYYYDKLIENLNILGYGLRPPTLLELYEILERYGLWSFVCAQRLLPVALLNPDKMSNVYNFMSVDEEGMAYKRRLLSNPRYVEQMQQILPWLIERKFLNINESIN